MVRNSDRKGGRNQSAVIGEFSDQASVSYYCGNLPPNIEKWIDECRAASSGRNGIGEDCCMGRCGPRLAEEMQASSETLKKERLYGEENSC